MAAAYGKFGLTMQPLGIILSVPLLFAAISFVIGAPWIGLMWIGSYISHLYRRSGKGKRAEEVNRKSTSRPFVRGHR